MDETTIKKAFGAAARFSVAYHLDRTGKRGLQAELSRMTEIKSSNLSEIIHKDKGTKEAQRKLIFSSILQLVPNLPAKTYEQFLSLGQWILDGKNPEDWKPTITGTGSFTMPMPKISGQATVSPPHEPEPSVGPSTREIHRIPVISWIRAGNWCEVEDPFHPGDADEWTDTTATMHPNAFALVVTGDSMEPLFHEGETIIVDPGREVINGSYVVAKNGDHEATFKQFVTDGSSVFLKPLNERYPIKDMTGVKFSIVGVVVAKEMRF